MPDQREAYLVKNQKDKNWLKVSRSKVLFKVSAVQITIMPNTSHL